MVQISKLQILGVVLPLNIQSATSRLIRHITEIKLILYDFIVVGTQLKWTSKIKLAIIEQ